MTFNKTNPPEGLFEAQNCERWVPFGENEATARRWRRRWRGTSVFAKASAVAGAMADESTRACFARTLRRPGNAAVRSSTVMSLPRSSPELERRQNRLVSRRLGRAGLRGFRHRPARGQRDVEIRHAIPQPMNGEARQFFAGPQVQLQLDVFPMRRHRLGAEMQPAGDFVGGIAVADQLENLQLAVAQSLGEGSDPALRHVAPDAVDDRILDLLTQIDLAAQHLADGLQQDGRFLLFHHIALGAGVQTAFGIERLVVHGQHESWQFRIADFDVLDQFDAIVFAQADVHHGDVGAQLLDRLEGGMGIPRLAADLEVRFPIDPQGQPLANDRVIVHQQDSLLDAGSFRLFPLSVFHFDLRTREGNVQHMIVPPPRQGANWSRAPIVRARQFMFSIPIPQSSAETLDNPRPLSITLSTVPPRFRWRETRISVAFP